MGKEEFKFVSILKCGLNTIWVQIQVFVSFLATLYLFGKLKKLFFEVETNSVVVLEDTYFESFLTFIALLTFSYSFVSNAMRYEENAYKVVILNAISALFFIGLVMSHLLLFPAGVYDFYKSMAYITAITCCAVLNSFMYIGLFKKYQPKI